MSLPPAIQPFRCANPDCTLPEGGRCARVNEFEEPEQQCPELARQQPGARHPETPDQPETRVEPATPRPPAPSDPAPWSGRHLDPTEAEHLLWRSPARLFAVLGPYGAGKTCLLTSFFLQLASPGRDGLPYRFASSLSLHGFRELAERARSWDGDPGHNIVDHTPVAESDQPRTFLHVGLRPADRRDDRVVDVLLADLPGEWIESFTSRNDDRAKRRLPFLERCDGFIVLADADELMGKQGRKRATRTGVLLRRLVSIARNKQPMPPIALVFSKFDLALDRTTPPEQPTIRRADWGALGKRAGAILAALESADKEGVPTAAFPVSAFPRALAAGQPVGVMEPFCWLLSHADRRVRRSPVRLGPPEGCSSFQAMRRWRSQA